MGQSTRLVIFSDIHMKWNELTLPKGDFLIFAGDATYQGKEYEIIPFLVWLESRVQNYKKVLFIGGNHDRLLEQDPSHFRQLKSIYAPSIIYLEQSSYKDTISGIKFHGIPFVRTINGNWSFERSEAEMEELVKQIPDDIDVLISHGPPYGILDNFYRKRAIDDPTARFGIRFEEIELKVGSKALLKRIQEIRPRVVCFGHIHENGNTKLEIDGITYINAAILDEHYEIAHEPMVIDV